MPTANATALRTRSVFAIGGAVTMSLPINIVTTKPNAALHTAKTTLVHSLRWLIQASRSARASAAKKPSSFPSVLPGSEPARLLHSWGLHGLLPWDVTGTKSSWLKVRNRRGSLVDGQGLLRELRDSLLGGRSGYTTKESPQASCKKLLTKYAYTLP